MIVTEESKLEHLNSDSWNGRGGFEEGQENLLEFSELSMLLERRQHSLPFRICVGYASAAEGKNVVLLWVLGLK